MADLSETVDRYRRLKLLGEGGAGQVWLVEDSLRPGSRLALKELADQAGSSPESLKSEFITLAGLRHPSLVEVHEFDTAPVTGRSRFSMEFIDGPDIVAAAGGDTPDVLIERTAEALRALSFLHDFGWIHRDLKPANLLVRQRPRQGCRLVILDFGLALRGESDDRARPAGTLPYIAPELLKGAEPSYRSDLYSLGVVFYEAVFGEPPFVPDHGDLAEFVRLKTSGLAGPIELPASWPRGLGPWLTRLLDPDPASRPATAVETLAEMNIACATQYPLELPITRAARLASGPPPGRDDEIRRIWDAFNPDRQPRLVLLTGDAGSGKTRILRWVQSEAVRRGWSTVGGLPPGGHATRAIDPFLARLRDSASRTRTLVVLDEVETADTPLVHLLERVASERDNPPLQIIAALRDSEIAHPRLKRLVDMIDLVSTAVRINLPPMSEESVRQVVQRVSGAREVSTSHVRWLVEASEGNPLQLESLIVEGAWESGGRARGHRSLKESIASRVGSLGSDAREWLTTLAILGAGTSESLISRVSDVSPEQSRRAAAEIAAVGLARQQKDRWSPSSRWVVSHLLAEMPEERLRDLYKRAATVVSAEGESTADAGRNARLWREAGDTERSVDCAIRASEKSQAENEASDAADWLRFALSQLERRDPRRQSLRVRQAELLSRADRHHASARAFAAAARLTGQAVKRAGLKIRQARALIYSGKFALALRIALTVKSMAETQGLERLKAQALTEEGATTLLLGNDAQAICILADAERAFGRLGDGASRATALHLAGLAYSKLRKLDQARACFEDALKLLEVDPDDGLNANILLALAVVEERASHWEKAKKIHLEAKRFLKGRQLQRQSLNLLINMANGYLRSGHYVEAIRLAPEAESIALRLGHQTSLIQSRLLRVEALAGCGRPAEALSILREILGRPLGGFEAAHVAYAKISVAEVQLEESNPRLDEIADHLAPLLSESVWDPRVAISALLIEMERRARTEGGEPVRPIWDRYLEVVRDTGIPPDPSFEVRRRLALGQSLLDTDLSEARSIVNEARTIAEEKDLPALAARACALFAEIARREGDDRSSASIMERARELLQSAAERIGDPDMRRDFLDRPVFAAIRASRTPAVEAGEKRLLAIYDMIRVLNSETDPDHLLESMLDMALEVVRAERGMILMREKTAEEFTVRLARNLEHETIRDAEEFSHNVVLRAGSGRSVLAVDTGKDERLRALRSVSLFGIRSVLCVPLRSRGAIVGAVYLDSRTEGRLFTPDDLRFLEAFADHAALALQNLRVRHRLERSNERLRAVAETRTRFGAIIGASAPMQRVYELVSKVAPSDLPVLIHGASGTGKELVAREIHSLSTRARRPYLTENCASIAESMLESELFGHVKGAFTGAERDHPGLFEQADGGTLFLDEVGDMSPSMQARLLRVLQEGELRRVGGEERVRVDVRILAATHRDLEQRVREGLFRQDLLYRLQVLVIQLPTLRERPGDVALLVEHLLARIADSRGRPAPSVTPRVMELLERCDWPGNVRQLENSLQRLVLLADDEPIDVALIESDRGLSSALLGGSGKLEPVYSLEQNERERIAEALRATGGHRARAAKLLGISRATIFRKIKEFKID